MRCIWLGVRPQRQAPQEDSIQSQRAQSSPCLVAMPGASANAIKHLPFPSRGLRKPARPLISKSIVSSNHAHTRTYATLSACRHSVVLRRVETTANKTAAPLRFVRASPILLQETCANAQRRRTPPPWRPESPHQPTSETQPWSSVERQGRRPFPFSAS